MTAGHRCYYADPSGGFGWPSCVICGAPVPTETARGAIRRCCNTHDDEDHTPTCASLDARRRRAGTVPR
ncbi:hypothetical protein I5G63_gp083 [Mycobacterium phage Imvubu]|uniref:Uncharacterized protein n=1 Tax=Mycobacterium phage Imvubu TaxID=2686233 RepID=A0A6B9LA11_9CAUD|nr:hypothetical protein I5G63_gp083 [Mycobacterium phage Imvubu]QHB37823.1 hypothetical protein PBI_IMVUBU_83 [Mycobacterium phage Imvubu]